ncbi:antibiotic biosynthesis monooxygenase [Thioalkalivibrio sp. ALJ1]|uniref:antibiotic biosynthesis monooxygenase family protein n=1 Tax=Thioalkalivibrio sp. ALJ1 TaxID=1158144 RepID=UPI00056FB62A|nr:antibiotic biosynthesis monooxygenase family protein [Thioalkalivibrio sp. ALJ1]
MIFVFEIHLRPGFSAEEYADAWVRASRTIQQAPGARGTRLHRKIGDPHVLLAIAHWESKDKRDAMEADQPDDVLRIIAEQAACVDVRVIGEFEDPAWYVDPPGADDASRPGPLDVGARS